MIIGRPDGAIKGHALILDILSSRNQFFREHKGSLDVQSNRRVEGSGQEDSNLQKMRMLYPKYGS